MTWWEAPLAGLVFGCAAYLGIQISDAICKRITPFEDGPVPGHPPTLFLIAGAILVGFTLAWRGVEIPQLGIAGLLIVSLVGSWYTDVRAGIISDYFTLVPLGVLVAGSVITGQYGMLVSCVAIAIPFAVAALFSRGRGMGWGDVKLVALGGAVLGIHAAIVAFAGACFVAVAIAYLRKKKTEPLPFAPYLAAAIALSLTLGVF